MKPAIIISTYPDKRSVSRIANRLVKERLAACVNITRISSVYSWQGKIENANEFLAVFKTTQKSKARLKGEIKRSHPYDVPEIAELAMTDINRPYLAWLIQSTG